MQKLQLMSKPQKRKFLSMDLIERMIRVEQKVSAAFNKSIPYKQTEYFKSLSLNQQEEFESYLKNKNKKKILSYATLLLPLLGLFLFSGTFTGNAIRDNLGSSYSILFVSLIVLFLVLAGFFISKYFYKKKMEEKYERNTKVIDDILLKKRFKRK